MASYQMMIKPCGPSCNLDCHYCFYLSKERMFAPGDRKMTDETLETFIRQYIETQSGKNITFAWQGGEPTLMGIEFFQRVVELQDKYRRPDLAIENTLQTNGTMLDDRWCRFLHDHRFLVGLSVDGPASLHDIYRRDKKGDPTSGKVISASRLLAKHQVEFNTLTVVNRRNARHPLRVYRFLRNIIGSRYMQFIPCVEPKGFEESPPGRWSSRTLPSIDSPAARPGKDDSIVTEWSVDPEDYGSFLINIFDEWVRKDVGRVFVINFEIAVGAWMGLSSSACTYAEDCGNALAIEHDGSVYSCDHYVYPEHRMGNIHDTDLAAMVASDRQRDFGEQKSRSLPDHCRHCEALFACRGECPRNRFVLSPDGEPGLNYLCKGLRKYFSHIDPWMAFMVNEMRSGRRVENVMSLFNAHKGEVTAVRPPRIIGARNK